MKNKKLPLVISVVIIFAIIFSSFLFNKDEKIKDLSSDKKTDSIEMDINPDNGDEKINWSDYQNKSYTLTNSITITESGTYNLTGTISDGLIKVNTDGNVKLVLDSVNIKNSSGPAIYIANASDVIIELKEGTTSTLEDGQKYSGYDADVIGTIFSHDDITFQGTGILNVTSKNADAIVGKDDLKIISGTYNIVSLDDGIRGKDSVYIKDGNFTINSDGDAIKSTNDTDTEKGYILIENGTYNITSTLDSIQAQTKLSIKNGNFVIKTGDGSSNTSTSKGWGSWGKTSSSSASAKGLKALDNIVIENGKFSFDTSDDAIHANNCVGIKNATINISSGDDGIHADKVLIIDSGEINITKSYEGIESAKITINGAYIDITSSDDGINVAGGKDSSAQNRPGANNYNSNTTNVLTINAGTIHVDASGDGIDVNGAAYINGGSTTVDGPTNPGNGAIDYDSTFEVNGGTLYAGAIRGMLQECSQSSTTYSVTITFNSTYSSNDKITIVDSNGKVIANYKSNKSYQTLIVATPNLKADTTYTIKINDTTYQTFKTSSIISTVGSTGNYNGPGGGGHVPRR